VGKTSLVRRFVDTIFSDTYLTTVGVTPADRKLGLLGAMQAWLDPDRTVLPRELVYPQDVTADEAREENAQLLERSQETAKVAALRELGLEVPEIVVVEPQSGLSIMRHVPAFFRGTLKEGPGLSMRSAASMEISARHPIHFHVDGEPRTGPNRIALRTRRRVLSPSGASSSRA